VTPRRSIYLTILLVFLASMLAVAMTACGGAAATPAATETAAATATAAATETATVAATETATATETSTASATAAASASATAVAVPARTGNKDVILATTTSLQDSGLLDVLLPDFEAKTGYTLKPVAVGSGQALQLGAQGDADVLFVHSPTAEEAFMKNGDGTDRRLVAHNFFILVGPASDPAGVKNTKTAVDAFKAISDTQSLFISRGDQSGTNTKELAIWKKAGLATPSGSWYQETGQGMGATLKIASEKAGYTLSDKATYLANKANLELSILLENDPDFLNIYSVIVVNPNKNSDINNAGAIAFADYMTGPDAQKIIADFGKDKYGEPLFFADAGKSYDQLK
jgi:tungstate transport system substrate-binding protein